MTGKWKGSIILVDCGDVLGLFRGEISNIDIENQTISLINVSRNDVKCTVPEITLSTNDIKSLKFLESSMSKEGTMAKTSSSPFDIPLSFNKDVSSSPLHEDSQKKKGDSKKKNVKTPKKWHKERDEECFNAPVDSKVLETEFDFEKNLALFDKQKVFDEINALSKSDHVKLVDCNKRGNAAKYRHDENVLSSFVPVVRQISVPCRTKKEYVTDSGLIVPSVTVEFKKSLYKKSEEFGFKLSIRLEMMGRAAAELVLQLLGGNHRLNPQNVHQKPTVVILCGPHVQGSQGVNCGRHLSNHCANVTVFNVEEKSSALTNELNLFKLSGGQTTSDLSALPGTVDIIIDALESYEDTTCCNKSSISNVRKWVSQSKATLLWLDPLPDCKSAEQNIILTAALPFPFENEKCSLNICDIGLPQGIYANLGCSYLSPFGSKFIATLYPKED